MEINRIHPNDSLERLGYVWGGKDPSAVSDFTSVIAKIHFQGGGPTLREINIPNRLIMITPEPFRIDTVAQLAGYCGVPKARASGEPIYMLCGEELFKYQDSMQTLVMSPYDTTKISSYELFADSIVAILTPRCGFQFPNQRITIYE